MGPRSFVGEWLVPPACSRKAEERPVAMKALVLSQNPERAPFPVMPLGPALCCEALARAGHEARLLDLCFASRPEDEMAAAVRAYRPDLVAIGVRCRRKWACPRTQSFFGPAARWQSAGR